MVATLACQAAGRGSGRVPSSSLFSGVMWKKAARYNKEENLEYKKKNIAASQDNYGANVYKVAVERINFQLGS